MARTWQPRPMVLGLWLLLPLRISLLHCSAGTSHSLKGLLLVCHNELLATPGESPRECDQHRTGAGAGAASAASSEGAAVSCCPSGQPCGCHLMPQPCQAAILVAIAHAIAHAAAANKA